MKEPAGPALFQSRVTKLLAPKAKPTTDQLLSAVLMGYHLGKAQTGASGGRAGGSSSPDRVPINLPLLDLLDGYVWAANHPAPQDGHTVTYCGDPDCPDNPSEYAPAGTHYLPGVLATLGGYAAATGSLRSVNVVDVGGVIRVSLAGDVKPAAMHPDMAAALDRDLIRLLRSLQLTLIGPDDHLAWSVCPVCEQTVPDHDRMAELLAQGVDLATLDPLPQRGTRVQFGDMMACLSTEHKGERPCWRRSDNGAWVRVEMPTPELRGLSGQAHIAASAAREALRSYGWSRTG